MQRRPTPMYVTTAALALAGLLTGTARAADVHIGINITPPSFAFEAPPRLVVVPGHPHVHYAPDVSVNFFSYGGRYYTHDGGNWFMAGDNRGPWSYVERRHVPAYVLNVPSRYYQVRSHHITDDHWDDRRRDGKYGKHGYGKQGKGRGHGGKKNWKHKGGRHHDRD